MTTTEQTGGERSGRAGLATPRFTVTPLSARIGAEITHIDLAEDLDDGVVASLRAALLEHQVLFFPGQHLGVEAHYRLASRFGELEQGTPVLVSPLDQAHPEVYALDTRSDKAPAGGKAEYWHMDQTFMPEPSAISILKVVVLPPRGGDTMWASLGSAYDSLGPAVQRLCEGLTAVHQHRTGATGYGFDQALAELGHGFWNGREFDRIEPTTHPLVTVHPETGRRCLFINPRSTVRINDLSAHESKALLQLLVSHMTRPEHVVRYRWTPGACAMWDNRATLHYAVNDYGDAPRAIQRISTQGVRPRGIADAPAPA